MNIFLVGNGFDLHYSLPTTYLNFLSTVNFLLKNKELEIKNVGDVFGRIAELKVDETIAISYAKYKSGYDSTLLPQKAICKMTTLAETNPWFSYFFNRKIKGHGWIDFEKEISNVLVILNRIFHCIDAKESIPVNIQPDAVDFLENFSLGDFFTDSFAPLDLGNCSCLSFASNSQLLFKFHDDYHFTQPEPPHYSSFNDAAVIRTILSSLYDFSELLAMYLKFFIDNPVKIFSKNHLVDRDRIFKTSEMVVSLNYTNTFEILYGAYQNTHVFHPHGTVGSKIVLGVNSDKYDAHPKLDTRFLGFKKYYQKAVYQTDDTYIAFLHRLRKIAGKGTTSINLFVFGHSLDSTDKEIIQELFEIADSIVIYFHKPSDIYNYAKKLISIYEKEGYERLRKKKGLFYINAKDLDGYWSGNRNTHLQMVSTCDLAASDKMSFSEYLQAIKARARYMRMASSEKGQQFAPADNNHKNHGS